MDQVIGATMTPPHAAQSKTQSQMHRTEATHCTTVLPSPYAIKLNTLHPFTNTHLANKLHLLMP